MELKSESMIKKTENSVAPG